MKNAEKEPTGVLVIEDESLISGYVRLILKKAGYRVFLAANECYLKEVWQAHRHEIQLVICDVLLPWRPGPEVVQELRCDQKELAVVLMSGLIPESGNDLVELMGDYEFLEKPFTHTMMLDALRTATARQLHPLADSELEIAGHA